MKENKANNITTKIKTKRKTQKKLTDKIKKKIIADYVDCQNYSETARRNNISDTSVKRVIKGNEEITKRVEEKKEENTKSVIETIENHRQTRAKLMENILNAMNEKTAKVDAFTNVRDLATAYGVIVDKELKFDELKVRREELQREQKAKEEHYDLPARLLGKAFVDVNRWIDDCKYTHYWFEGGRGSIKSSYIAEKVIDIIMNNPNACGLILRKVKDTLKDSVYANIVWAIEMMELSDKFICTQSPMQIKRKDTGQIIYFRGADKPEKIKSIKPPKDKYIAVLWYEEFDQFNGMEEVRNINQSVIRGGEKFWVFNSYNTPRSNHHWVNKEKIKVNTERLLHHSTYLEAPKEFLGNAFFMEAEQLKYDDPQSYEHEYMGLAVGTGGQVFERVELREITDEEIATFSNIYQGLDFGWFPDPAAWGRMSYNPAQETIYIFDEIYQQKLPNEKLGNMILKRSPKEDMYCDNAEPKSISDLKGMGLYAREVVKGPGSVEYGVKWLARRKIVIDPKRCPNTAREFNSYELEKNKDGEFISSYPDKDNHSIDMTRYALSRVMRYRENKA